MQMNQKSQIALGDYYNLGEIKKTVKESLTYEPC